MPQLNTFREYAHLQYCPPGQTPHNIAVLLLDPDTDSLQIHFARDWSSIDPCDLDIVSALAEDLHMKAAELGAAALVSYLYSTLSNMLRISDMKPLLAASEATALEELDKALNRRPASFENEYCVRATSSPTLSQGDIRKKLRHLLEAARRQVEKTLHPPSYRVLYKGVLSALLVACLTVSSGVLRRSNAPLVEGTRKRTQQRPQANMNESRDITMPSHVVVKYIYSRTSVGTRATQTRRARHSREHSESRVPARPFVPPDTAVSLPEVSELTPADISIEPVDTVIAYVPEERALTTPPAPEHVGGVRRVLLTLISPFRRFGRSFTD